jgi:Putative zinc-finger
MSRDRDRTLEQALKQELGAAGTPDRDACVDAETLGAWADGGLDGAQMAAVELHVSSCARCQAIAGATARSAPLPAGTEAAGTFFLWRWWLAPLVASAAAVTLWVVVPGQRNVAVPPPSVPAPAAATDAFKQSQPKDQAANDASAAKPAEPGDAPAARAQRATPPQQARADRREQGFSDKKEESQSAKKDAGAPKLAQEKPVTAEAAPAAPAAPPPSPPASASAPALRDLQKSARVQAAPVEIVSTDPSRRWRIVDGAIERSEDGGASWAVAIRPPAGDSITGGTAPARSICWLIGSSGLVMVTSDGITFARVPLPERVDLTAVTATDARTAIVTTADGRRFRTDDAGRTWRQF